MAARFSVRPIVPTDWERIETLFGSNGACGGCWCMYWRVPSTGKYWAEHKGERNRATFEALVRSGKARGILAFAGAEPVGWCSVGPREDFAYLARAPKLRDASPDGTWSVTCFFITRRVRRHGVALSLLRAAREFASDSGASSLEGFPVKPSRPGSLPDAFIHTGVPALFEQAGFSLVADLGGRLLYRVGLS